MRLERGLRFGPPTLAMAARICLVLYAPALLSQSDTGAVQAPASADSEIADPTQSIVVGPRAAVGTDTAGEKAAKGVVGGVLGSVFGSAKDSRKSSDRPDTQRDPSRKLDYAEFETLDGALETAARAQWTDDGLLVSTRIDDAPGKGTFQAVFLQACNGPRLYPSRYEIYKLWDEGGFSVSWSSSTMSDGEVVQQDSGNLSGQWDDGVSHDELSGGPGTWRQLGFDKAHHGARQIGAYFDISSAELAQFENTRLFVHTTLPSQDPVSTAVSVWTIAPGERESLVIGPAGQHVDSWWGHCNGWAAVAAAGALPSVANSQNSDIWNEMALVGVEAKLLAQPQGTTRIDP